MTLLRGCYYVTNFRVGSPGFATQKGQAQAQAFTSDKLLLINGVAGLRGGSVSVLAWRTWLVYDASRGPWEKERFSSRTFRSG